VKNKELVRFTFEDERKIDKNKKTVTKIFWEMDFNILNILLE
jgi:hypothetical protein